MQINNISEHIRRKKQEMSDTQDMMNEAYARALSRGKSSYSQKGFSNNYLKKNSTLTNPAIIFNTTKKSKQEGTISDTSQETKSQFTDKVMQESKMT